MGWEPLRKNPGFIKKEKTGKIPLWINLKVSKQINAF